MEKPAQEYPEIRPLMVFPVKTSNGESICMRDPEGFSDATIAINYPTYFIISLMDGTRTVRDIREEFKRQTGEEVPSEQILELIRKLGQALFMNDETFRVHRKNIEEGFRNAKTRAPAHSGSAYPESPEELSSFFKELFNALKNPKIHDGEVQGIIAPHIDIRQAGACYAAAYNHLRKSPVSTVIILGTAHSNAGSERYSICSKDFDTPLGPLPCDREGIEAVQDATGKDWTEEQLVHRTEHSVEFQAIFLRYLFPDREIKIIPVLCNSFADLMDREEGPMYDNSVRTFIEALQNLLNRQPGKVVLIAGADLSHVGPKFGHPTPLNETDLTSLKEHDLGLITYAAKGDPEGFFREIRKERDRHNVCGVPNIYTFLKVLEGRKGELLDYGQFFEEPTASAVSYASLVF